MTSSSDFHTWVYEHRFSDCWHFPFRYWLSSSVNALLRILSTHIAEFGIQVRVRTWQRLAHLNGCHPKHNPSPSMILGDFRIECDILRLIVLNAKKLAKGFQRMDPCLTLDAFTLSMHLQSWNVTSISSDDSRNRKIPFLLDPSCRTLHLLQETKLKGRGDGLGSTLPGTAIRTMEAVVGPGGGNCGGLAWIVPMAWGLRH